MGAFPLVMGAISSAASTASSFSGGTSYNTNAMQQVSLDQVAYLEQRQRQKEALTLQMMDVAKNFANANFDSELSQLDLMRQQQEVQIEQQGLLANYNYRNTQATLKNQEYLYNVGNRYEDYQKAQAYQSSMYGLQTGMDARTIQLLAEEQARTQGLNYGNQQRELEYNATQQQRELEYNATQQQRALDLSTSVQGRALGLNNAEQGREFTRLQGEAAHNQTLQESEFNQAVGKQQFDMGEQSRALNMTAAAGNSELGRTQKLVDLERQSGELDQAETQMNQSGLEAQQAGSAQVAQTLMSLGSDLHSLSTASEEAISEASKRMIMGGSSSSDGIKALNDQKITEIHEASQQASIQNAMSRGLIDANTGSALASIRASKAGLITKRQAILSDSKLDEVSRATALAQLAAEQKLTSLAESFAYLTIPTVQGGIQNSISKLNNIDFVGTRNQISRDYDLSMYNLENERDTSTYNIANNLDASMYNLASNLDASMYNLANTNARSQYDLANRTGRSMYDLQNTSDLYNMNVATGAYAADAGYSNVMRQQDYDALNYANQQAYAEYQQAQSDVNYGSQLTQKNYELGKYAAEQNRLSTMSATDLKQAAYLAQQRAALAQALSGIQTGMLSSGTGGGSNWGSGISSLSSLFGGLASLFNKNQSYQAQNNYLNRMSNLGSPTYRTGTPGTSYGTWNSGTSGSW
jgi:hypothetical protein